MMLEDSQTETGEVMLIPFDLIAGTSESTRAKTVETFLELLGARVRNPNTRSAYQVAWRSFLAFCSARQLEPTSRHINLLEAKQTRAFRHHYSKSNFIYPHSDGDDRCPS
jgi:hypothetical protein